MDLEYFKKQIYEEIDGAKDYIKRAIEIKAMNPQWGSMFLDMSKAELSHASNLYRMVGEYYQKAFEDSYPMIPLEYEKLFNDLSEKYTNGTVEVEMLQDLYKGGSR